MVSTAAILIGASKFPKHAYGETQSFATSSRDFRAYLQDGEVGLDVADENILNLFDSARSGSDQLMSIGRFLDRLATQANTETARDVILYYVGHGSFAGERQDYILAISSMDPSYEAVTGLRVADLAGVLKDRARHFRFFVILDCCFAGEALDTFQSADPSEAAARKAATWFDSGRPKRQSRSPTRGIALLCAADRDSPAYGAAITAVPCSRTGC